MKKIVTLAVIMVMALALLAACNRDNDPAPAEAGPVTISWMAPNWNEDVVRELAAEFMADNEDIIVEIIVTDWDTYRSRVTTVGSAANAPELATILLSDVRPLATMGILQPLNELGAQAGVNFSDFLPPALDMGTVDGNIYALAYRYDGSGIFYNVDILEAAGFSEFPRTWDGMLEMASILSDDGIHAFAWPLGNQAEAVTRLIQQLNTFGGSILNEDETASTIDSPQSRIALGNIVYSIQDGLASPGSPEFNNTIMRNMFGSGQLAFNFTGPFDLEVLADEFPDLNFRTAVIPGDGGMGVTTANGWCVAMLRTSNNQEEAARFLAYIMLPENQARLTHSFPASQTAIQFPEFSTPELAPFAEQLQNSVAEPAFTRWAEIEPIIFMHIQQAVAGMVSVDEAISNMHRDLNALLAS